VTLSIRERIEQRLAVLLATVSGVGTVRRLDTRARFVLAVGDVLLWAGEEYVLGRSETAPTDVTSKTLPLAVLVRVLQSEADTLTTAQRHNAWLQALEEKLMSDRFVTEPAQVGPPAKAAQRLATDLRITRLSSPPLEDETSETYAWIEFEVDYQHDLLYTSTLGTLITAVQQAVP
jgi:hypothetical protein